VDPFGTFKVYTGTGVDGKWFTTDDVVGDPATLEGERVLQGLPWYGSTGLYHLRNRWYSPSLQRFLSLDPLGFDAGDANLYRFEGNDPLGNLDPMGANVWTPEFRDQAIWTGVTAFATGVAIGAVLTVASPAIVTAAVIVGAAMLMKSAIDVGAKGYQAYTGTDMLGRPLCPNQIEQLEREMILEGVGFAAGMLGGGLGGRMAGGAGKGGLYKGLTENSGRAGNKGSGVYIGEATSGNAPRGNISPPGIGSSAKPSVGPGCTGGACAEGMCFPAGTPISVDSVQRHIEEIKTGDTVLAMDPTTRALTRSRVAQTFVRLATSFVLVFAGGDSIASTSEHPYWTSQHSWTAAKELRTGDSLWMPTQGQLLAIDSLRRIETPPTKVFNVEVEGVHNYLVGTHAVAVHNACTQPGPTVDSRSGSEVGRFIVDSRGNTMIEPVGGRTVPAGQGGVDTHTLYPNGSNYQRLNPVGHGTNGTPHGHGHFPGTGPGKNGQGSSMDPFGNQVPFTSPDAHWPINRTLKNPSNQLRQDRI